MFSRHLLKFTFWAALSTSLLAANPQKLMICTVTVGFRHSSIETAEKVLTQLADQSGGAFTVDFVRQIEGMPANPGKPPVRDAKADTDESFAKKPLTTA